MDQKFAAILVPVSERFGALPKMMAQRADMTATTLYPARRL